MAWFRAAEKHHRSKTKRNKTKKKIVNERAYVKKPNGGDKRSKPHTKLRQRRDEI